MESNKWIMFFIILIFSFEGNGQNLIRNPSFEDTTGCPFGAGDIQKAIGWVSFSATPDYFNSCAGSCSGGCAGIPKNFYGFQWPYDGDA